MTSCLLGIYLDIDESPSKKGDRSCACEVGLYRVVLLFCHLNKRSDIAIVATLVSESTIGLDVWR